MRILLDNEEIQKFVDEWNSGCVVSEYDQALTKATGKKILIQLQAIYNIPGLGAEDKRMGEFIQSLQEEVG